MVELVGKLVRLRQVTPGDAPGLLRLYEENREFLRPWEPERSPEFYTLERQRQLIEKEITERRLGLREVFVIRDDSGDIVGRISLNDVVRGVTQTVNVGYNIAQRVNGRGYATETVRLAVDYAFDDLKLHRVAAGTMLSNVASQRVLEKAGFRREGIAKRLIKINGRWEDHYLFAITIEDRDR
jgi:ribosomal-protein-alanine N-acetyltransferase